MGGYHSFEFPRRQGPEFVRLQPDEVRDLLALGDPLAPAFGLVVYCWLWGVEAGAPSFPGTAPPFSSSGSLRSKTGLA
jgi:hypothetical protein